MASCSNCGATGATTSNMKSLPFFYLISSAGLVVSLTTTCVAELTVIDFEGLRYESEEIRHYDEYVEDGFRFEYIDLNPSHGPDGISVMGTEREDFYGSTAVWPSLQGYIEMRRLDGGTFNVFSVDLIEHFPREVASSRLERWLDFYGEKPDGSLVSQRFYGDEILGFQTFNFIWFNDIERLYWSWEDDVSWHNKALRVDNLTMSDFPNVPDEANSCLLSLGGFLALGLLRWRARCSPRVR